MSKDTSAEPVENALATSQEWINTLKEAQNYLLTHNNTLSPELDQKLSELGSKLKYQKQYQSDPTLKNQKVEYNNDGLLSNQDEIQITKFALSLINPIREQLGMPALTITQNALKIANNVANTYNRDNWIAYTYNVDSQGNETPIMKGHDANAFENAINASNPANTGASSEAMSASEEQDVYDKNGKRTGVTHYIAPTMDDLYARIYGDVAGMLFTDSNMQWGHTYTLLGMGRKNENQTNNIGVQTDRYGQTHYVLESSSQNDHSNLINVNNNDASQAYQNLLNAEDNYKKFINDHQNDDLNFSDMVSEQDYKDDKASYDADPNGAWAPTYKATVDQYNKQQAALKPYLDAIDQAQTKLDQVYFAKTSDNSKTDDHAAQLANAKQALQDAQAKLETAKQEASQASADLANAKADASTAADELKAAQDKLVHDSGSSMSLADAQKALKNAKAVLAQKQVNLADAKKAAQKAQAMQHQADSALASAKVNSQKAQAALAEAQTMAKSAQTRIDEFTGADKAVAAAQDKLNAANEALQVAKSNHDTARENLIKAQDVLKTAKSKLKAAQDTASQASQALTEAQQKEDAAKAAYETAKETYLTDKAKLQDLEALAAKEDEYVVAFEQASDKLNEAQAALDEAQKALQDKNASLSVANGEVKYWEGVLAALESKPATSDQGTQTDETGTSTSEGTQTDEIGTSTSEGTQTDETGTSTSEGTQTDETGTSTSEGTQTDETGTITGEDANKDNEEPAKTADEDKVVV
ncbi:SEC10/PgrA surface exclusion domain-containing protein, partial [Lactobacillus salivarius]|nr:SEC10/PgrA surface exclusion domain-containing protein [Ligilactobacillus salivarius]